jgi:hypothetical protein
MRWAAQTADAAALADSVSGQLSGGSLSASASKKPAYPDEQEMDRARQFLAGFRERVAVLARASSEREQAVENTLVSMTQVTGAFDAMARDPAGPAQVPGLPESVCQPVLPEHRLAHPRTESGFQPGVAGRNGTQDH